MLGTKTVVHSVICTGQGELILASGKPFTVPFDQIGTIRLDKHQEPPISKQGDSFQHTHLSAHQLSLSAFHFLDEVKCCLHFDST